MEADIVKCYKPLLHDQDIKESFRSIVQRSKKLAKPVRSMGGLFGRHEQYIEHFLDGVLLRL
jgi:hypothetical protein